MATPATASSRMSIDSSSRAGGWMARGALSVGSTITGSSPNEVWPILVHGRPPAHHDPRLTPCSAMASMDVSLPSEP
jgi:hypothetical protein